MENVENREVMSLGGNIELNGFQNVERSKLVVLKKIIGNLAKEMKEKRSDYEKLTITLQGDENNAQIKAELLAGGSSIIGEDSKGNVFISIDGALKRIIEQI